MKTVSASREKRTRQNTAAAESTEKKQHRKSDDNNERSSTILYTVVGVIVAVAAVALLVWNSNFFQNRAAAVTINGEKYTAADVQFYYNSARQYEAYYGMMGMSTYDYNTAAEDQMYDEAAGTTWRDYLLDQAVESLTQEVALAKAAQAEGYALSEDAQASVDSTLSGLESSWAASGYSSRDAYLRASYGSSMSYDKFVSILTRSALASDYASYKQASFTYDQATLDDYYQENKDTLDTYTVSQFLFQAVVSTTDDAGNTIEMTDDEIAAALEDAKVEAKANAEALEARLKAGEDPEALEAELEEQLTSSYVNSVRLGSRINTEYSDWAFDSARRAGDVNLVEYEGGSNTTYNYCVVLFQGREKDDSNTANIRHVLVSAGNAPTEDEYADAKAQAEDLLAEWESGEATEDSFAQMAVDNSADTSSASSGGLMNVTPYSGYVDTFTDWALDSSRKPGDTGIVQNTGSTTKGYHIMYFVGWDSPVWEQTAESSLRSADISAWQEELMSGYSAETGSGLKYVD